MTIELNGKYNKDCKIFCDTPEEGVIAQVMQVLNHHAFSDSPIRIMPDCHQGAGCVIGFTGQFKNIIIPNLIGVDIGCGMITIPLKCNPDKLFFESLDYIIRNLVPSGCTTHKVAQKSDKYLYEQIEMVCKNTNQDFNYVLKSLASLGGGNHFIELGKSEKNHYLTIHSGSRNFGLKVAKFYQDIASSKNKEYGKDLAYLTGIDAENYLRDMKVAQLFADQSRRMMIHNITEALDVQNLGHATDLPIVSVHNYISDDNYIRKGAISAKKGENVIIPWNMRDGLILGVGKGNSDFNYSAPHGAGRVLSRSKAKEKIKLEDFIETMSNVYSTTVNSSTIDESPFAYKPSEEIEIYLKDTVDIVERVVPIYNFKASE